MRKVILRQTQSPGDILTMTRVVADLATAYPDWLIDVRSPCPEIWQNNPHLSPLKESDAEVFTVHYNGINQSGVTQKHWTEAFHEDVQNQLGITLPKNGIKPEIYLSEEEKGWINQTEIEFGWHGAFWLLNAGHKPDNELKQYHRWQEVIDLLNDYWGGVVRIVQVGHKAHNHPELKDVYSLVGKTDLRQLIRLAWWAQGTIGPLSFQFVLSAALEQPHVVVAAGKEGVRWHLYPHGRYIYTNGALACCKWDGCWKGGKNGECVDLVYGVPHCFRLIKPYMIADAVKMYYEGGILGLERSK